MSDPSSSDRILIPFNEVPHLFAVMNNPCSNGLCLILMISSIKQGRPHDAACILDAGDHEFIRWPSYIVYRIAEQISATHMKNMLDKKYYTAKGKFKEDVFRRIASGIYSSAETRGTILKYARAQGI